MTKITQLPPTFKQRVKEFFEKTIVKRIIGIIILSQIIPLIGVIGQACNHLSIVKGIFWGEIIDLVLVTAITVIILIVLVVRWSFDLD